MWDEEKFFKDFVRESENVKPDEQFVNELKKMAEDGEKKTAKIQWNERIKLARTAAVIAVLMIVCIAGIDVFLKSEREGRHDVVESKSPSKKADVHAGNDETSIYIGTIGGKSELEKTIDFLEDKNIAVTDAAGRNISTKERKNILEKLNNVKHIVERSTLEELKSDTEYVVYQIEEKEVVIKIYDSGYVVINNTALYQIEE